MSPEFGFSRENDNHNTLVYTGARGLLVKVKSAYEPHQAGAYPGFCSIKRLGVFLLPLDGMCLSITVLPPALSSPVPIYTPGWRKSPAGLEPRPLGPESKALTMSHRASPWSPALYNK